jgi:hypothetical protein
MARRFGPTLGAGVVVEELPTDKLLESAPLGVTLYIGILEKGDTGKLISTASKRDMERKIGYRIDESQAPDAGQDFWFHSAGAGEVHFLRVTDGTERQAERTLYSREALKLPVVKLQAHNAGRWAGRWMALVGEWTTTATDLNETTLATGKTMKVDEWKGANLVLDAVGGKVYTVVSNDAAGLLTVKTGTTMKTDYAAGSDKGYQLELPRDLTGNNNGGPRELTYRIGDGDSDSVNNWSLQVFVNGSPTKRWGDLSMDPASKYYFVRLINDDDSNFEILATDLNAPNAPLASKRPANECGVTASVTTFSLVQQLMQLRVTLSPTGANPTVAAGTTSDVMKFRDRIECTMTSTSAFTAKSLDLGGNSGTLGSGTLASPFTPNCPLLPPFTVTNGSTILASGDKFVIDFFPFVPNELVGGYIHPDIAGNPLKRYLISGNDHKSVTISNGDLTAEGATSKLFRISYPQPLGGAGSIGGYDGIAGVVDSKYITPHLDATVSKAKGLIGQNKGLVKVAIPGVTSTTVQKSGLSFAEAMNWQFRVEIPDTTITEDSAVNFINSTIGRNDMGVTILPSYADIDDPRKPGQLKRQTMTGMIHGREALVAKNYDGYHKAAAGIDVSLPLVKQLPVEGLNEEVLNPVGINVVKKLKGNFIIWGDRTISLDPAWHWKHQREYFSHIENRLRDSFDYIIFAINDPIQQAALVTTLREMFRPELAKRAIRGKDLADAVSIKVDGDVNTDATRAAGDLIAEIKIRPADTVERCVFRVGRAGIFEALN